LNVRSKGELGGIGGGEKTKVSYITLSKRPYKVYKIKNIRHSTSKLGLGKVSIGQLKAQELDILNTLRLRAQSKNKKVGVSRKSEEGKDGMGNVGASSYQVPRPQFPGKKPGSFVAGIEITKKKPTDYNKEYESTVSTTQVGADAA